LAQVNIMKSIAILLLISFIVASTAQVSPTAVYQCLESNYTSEVTACQSDTVCNASLSCFAACTAGNTTCY